MNTIEEMLRIINKFKAKQHFSLDIYYNDLDDTFVVKVHGYNMRSLDNGVVRSESVHFRNEKLIDSLLGAYDFCKNQL